MTDLNFLDHSLNFTYKDLHGLQSEVNQNHIQKHKLEKYSIAIWSDVDTILEQSRKNRNEMIFEQMLASNVHAQCIDTGKQTNESERHAEKILSIDVLDVSFESNEFFESPKSSFTLSNVEREPVKGKRKKIN